MDENKNKKKKKDGGLKNMLIKTHKLTMNEINYIKNTGQGGENGYLKQILPLQHDGKTIHDPGPRIAHELHTTHKSRKRLGLKKNYFIFELVMQNNKIGFYLWAEDENTAAKITNAYKACYPSIDFRDTHEKFFITLDENDYVACARLIPKNNRYLPISTILNGEIWQNIFSQIKSEDPYDKAVIQIIIWPMKRSKMKKWGDKVQRRKDVQNPTAKYAELTNLWDAKTHSPPFRVVFRIVMLGRKPQILLSRLSNVLDVFNSLNSGCGGNMFERKIYNTRQHRFLNAMEDRDVNIGETKYSFVLSADEIGHNFLALPAGDEVDVLPIMDTMKVERMPIPEELIQRSTQSKVEVDKKYMFTLRHDGVMTDEELSVERKIYEQRQRENEEKACVLDAEWEAYINSLNQRIIDIGKKEKSTTEDKEIVDKEEIGEDKDEKDISADREKKDRGSVE